MKTLVKISFGYGILGLMLGVFYREFTKLNDFTGKTMLAGLHTHALVLGAFFFLLVLIFEKTYKLTTHKKYKPFLIVYNAGLLSMIVLMTIRGIFDIFPDSLSGAWNTAISWIAGATHVAMAAGLVRFFMLLLARIKEIETHKDEEPTT